MGGSGALACPGRAMGPRTWLITAPQLASNIAANEKDGATSYKEWTSLPKLCYHSALRCGRQNGAEDSLKTTAASYRRVRKQEYWRYHICKEAGKMVALAHKKNHTEPVYSVSTHRIREEPVERPASAAREQDASHWIALGVCNRWGSGSTTTETATQ